MTRRRDLLKACGAVGAVGSTAGCLDRVLPWRGGNEDDGSGAGGEPPKENDSIGCNCSGHEEENESGEEEDNLEAANPEPEPTNEPNESDYASPDEVNESQPQKENITISNKNLETGESTAVATGTLTNENAEALDVVDIEVTFLDKQGDPIISAWWGTSDLGAGEAWDFEVRASGTDLGNAVDFDIRIVL